MCRLPTCLRKPPTTKRSTPRSGSSCFTTASADTADNLKDAAAGENYEWTDMYATFAKERQGRGLRPDRMTCLRASAGIEKEHEERYLKLLQNVEEGIVFSKDGDTIWQCANCGHIVVGEESPRSVSCLRPSPGLFPDQS